METLLGPFGKIAGYPVVACKYCCIGILASSGLGHISSSHDALYSKHDAVRIGWALSAFGEKRNLVRTAEGARDASNMPHAVPEIPELGSPGRDGLGCRYCNIVLAGTFAATSMARHLKTSHEDRLQSTIEGESTYLGHYDTDVPYQKMFRSGAGSRPFRVILSTGAGRSNASTTPACVSPDTEERTANEWLRRDSWSRYHSDMSPDAVRALSDPPGISETQLSKAVNLSVGVMPWLFARVSLDEDLASACSLAAEHADAECFPASWRSPTSKTQHMHAQLLGHLVLHFGRKVRLGEGKRGRWQPTALQTEAFTRLLQQASTIGATEEGCLLHAHSLDDPVTRAIVELTVASMSQELPEGEPLSVVHSTLATLALGSNDEVWKPGLSLVPLIAGFLSIGRLAILTYRDMVDDTHKHSLADVDYCCSPNAMQQGVGAGTTMRWLEDVTNDDGRAAVDYCEPSSELHWEGETVFVDGRPFSGRCIRSMAQALVDRVEQAMADLLQLSGPQCLRPGSDRCTCTSCDLPPIPWDDIVDDSNDESPQDSTFIDHSEWRRQGCGLRAQRDWLSRRISNDHTLRERWYGGAGVAYCLLSIRSYAALIDAFLCQLVACFYFLGGPPPDPEELASCRWRDGPHVARNIEVRDGLVYLLLDEGYEYETSPRARVLPPRVACCLVWYIWLVVPFEEELAASLGDTARSSPFLFTHSRLSGLGSDNRDELLSPSGRGSHGGAGNPCEGKNHDGRVLCCPCVPSARPVATGMCSWKYPDPYIEVEDFPMASSTSAVASPAHGDGDLAIDVALGKLINVKALSSSSLLMHGQQTLADYHGVWKGNDIRRLVAHVLSRHIYPRTGVRCWKLVANAMASRFLGRHGAGASPPQTWLEIGSCGLSGVKYCRWRHGGRSLLGTRIVSLLDDCHRWHVLLGVCRVGAEGHLPCSLDEAPEGDGEYRMGGGGDVLRTEDAWPTCPGRPVEGYRPLRFLPEPVGSGQIDDAYAHSQLTNETADSSTALDNTVARASSPSRGDPRTIATEGPLYSPRTMWEALSPVAEAAESYSYIEDLLAVPDPASSFASADDDLIQQRLEDVPPRRDSTMASSTRPSTEPPVALAGDAEKPQDLDLPNEPSPVDCVDLPSMPCFREGRGTKRPRPETPDGSQPQPRSKPSRSTGEQKKHKDLTAGSPSEAERTCIFLDSSCWDRSGGANHHCGSQNFDIIDAIGSRNCNTTDGLLFVINLLVVHGSNICLVCVAHGPVGGCTAAVTKVCRRSTSAPSFEEERKRVQAGIIKQCVALWPLKEERHITCIRCLRPWHTAKGSRLNCTGVEPFAADLLLAICHRLGDDDFTYIQTRVRRLSRSSIAAGDSFDTWTEVFAWLARKTTIGIRKPNFWVFLALSFIELRDRCSNSG
ncbi:hypothetical protein FPOAC2_10388 [Fusarium poae]